MSSSKSSFIKLSPVQGWLLDVYPSGESDVTVWLIAESGERIRLVDSFTHRFFVSGSFYDLRNLTRKIEDDKSIESLRFVKKQPDFMEAHRKKVLEIGVADFRSMSSLASRILELDKFRRFKLHNVDVSVPQMYLYEKDVFPLAFVMAVASGKRLCLDLRDSVESVDYRLPPLRSLRLDVNIRKEGALPKFTDKIDSMSLGLGDKVTVIDGGSEQEKILGLVEAVKEEDPDIILTAGGDSFLMPYLAYRASASGVLGNFVLSREGIPLRAEKGQGKTFFSYGRVYHKAPTQRLFGRVHIDLNNTFIYEACGLEGLTEVSRTCRVPLQRAARASIGSIMSSLQLYTAWKEDILIPWKKTEPEAFKSGRELLVADRGGFVFEPKLGFHTDVVEVDFTSMFPMLMLTRNISAETVLCKCCPDSKLRVPELGYNICEKRRGIVPKTLDLLLKKRSRYKDLMRETGDKDLKHAYNMRQAALKWILVTCFGYLGYRNARFGKVDAHIAVCAFAREELLKAATIAEQHGFEVIHGIVDSLWLKKRGFSPQEVAGLCYEVSKAVSVPLGVEGKYRWIVFLPSKILANVPVLNRYYGVFENGAIKMRGVEARRKDTPRFVYKAQMDMIRKLAEADSLDSFKAKASEALKILGDYAEALAEGRVDVHELLVTKYLSKNPSRYTHVVLQAIAAKQLEKAGFDVRAGQTVQYLVVNAKSRWADERVVAAQLLKPNARYDVKEYLKMLVSAGETLLGVLGYSKEGIQTLILSRHRQTMLLANAK